MPHLGPFWVQHGYAYIAQDVRGRFQSEGAFGRVDEISEINQRGMHFAPMKQGVLMPEESDL